MKETTRKEIKMILTYVLLLIIFSGGVFFIIDNHLDRKRQQIEEDCKAAYPGMNLSSEYDKINLDDTVCYNFFKPEREAPRPLYPQECRISIEHAGGQLDFGQITDCSHVEYDCNKLEICNFKVTRGTVCHSGGGCFPRNFGVCKCKVEKGQWKN